MVYALGSSYIVEPSDKGCNLEIQSANFFRFRLHKIIYFHAWKDLNIPETYLFNMVCLLQAGIFNLFYLPYKQRFLSCMDFRVYEVVHLACQSHKLQEKPLQ